MMLRTQNSRRIAKIIGEYAALWKVAPWVTQCGFTSPDINVYFCRNPMAMDVIDESNISWRELCENPADWAVNLLMANLHMIEDWYFVAGNSNKRAFRMVEAMEFDDEFLRRNEIDEMLSANPNAIGFLRAQPTIVDHTYLMWNPAAEDLIAEMKIPIFHGALAVNPADWAVDILLQPGVIEDIDNKYSLSGNTNPRIVAYLLEHSDLIDWDSFSGNPAAIEHLRANPRMVTENIYSNPRIFELTIPDGLVELVAHHFDQAENGVV